MTTPVPSRTYIPGLPFFPGGPGRPPAAISPDQSLELQVGMLKKQIESYKKKNDSIKAQIAKLDPKNPRYKAQKALLDIQWKRNNDLLAKANEQFATKQNKLWESKGEYDKLLGGTERDAFMAINALFKNYGLESLAGKIYEYVKGGYSPDTISILLQDTKEYKERFAGNELRKKAGLPVLSPGEYLATEASYRQIMQSAGLPAGFYDQASDFNKWIAGNVSPQEIQSRVDLATQATILASPHYRKALNQLGISDKDLTAYFLDPSKALPHLQKSAATAAIGSEALRQGLTFDQAYAANLATSGISAEEARQGYAQIGAELGTLQQLGNIYGQDYTQRTGEEAILEGKASAIRSREKLIGREKGAFSGAAGAARGGLASRGGAR